MPSILRRLFRLPRSLRRSKRFSLLSSWLSCSSDSSSSASQSTDHQNQYHPSSRSHHYHHNQHVKLNPVPGAANQHSHAYHNPPSPPSPGGAGGGHPLESQRQPQHSSNRQVHPQFDLNHPQPQAGFMSPSASSVSIINESNLIAIHHNHNHNQHSVKVKLKQHVNAVTHQGKSDSTKPASGGHTGPIVVSSSTSAGHIRTKRLMKEYRDIMRASEANKLNGQRIFAVELVNDSLYEWNVKLFRFDPESQLARDLVEFGVDHVLINATFPDNFPFEPPFVRIVSPYIEKGYVMEGGSLCLELLTKSGWASAYTMEAVIMQVASTLVKGQARIRRGKAAPTKEFNRKTAEASYKSLVKTHEKYGWVTPPLADG